MVFFFVLALAKSAGYDDILEEVSIASRDYVNRLVGQAAGPLADSPSGGDIACGYFFSGGERVDVVSRIGEPFAHKGTTYTLVLEGGTLKSCRGSGECVGVEGVVYRKAPAVYGEAFDKKVKEAVSGELDGLSSAVDGISSRLEGKEEKVPADKVEEGKDYAASGSVEIGGKEVPFDGKVGEKFIVDGEEYTIAIRDGEVVIDCRREECPLKTTKTSIFLLVTKGGFATMEDVAGYVDGKFVEEATFDSKVTASVSSALSADGNLKATIEKAISDHVETMDNIATKADIYSDGEFTVAKFADKAAVTENSARIASLEERLPASRPMESPMPEDIAKPGVVVNATFEYGGSQISVTCNATDRFTVPGHPGVYFWYVVDDGKVAINCTTCESVIHPTAAGVVDMSDLASKGYVDGKIDGLGISEYRRKDDLSYWDEQTEDVLLIEFPYDNPGGNIVLGMSLFDRCYSREYLRLDIENGPICSVFDWFNDGNPESIDVDFGIMNCSDGKVYTKDNYSEFPNSKSAPFGLGKGKVKLSCYSEGNSMLDQFTVPGWELFRISAIRSAKRLATDADLRASQPSVVESEKQMCEVEYEEKYVDLEIDEEGRVKKLLEGDENVRGMLLGIVKKDSRRGANVYLKGKIDGMEYDARKRWMYPNRDLYLEDVGLSFGSYDDDYRFYFDYDGYVYNKDDKKITVEKVGIVDFERRLAACEDDNAKIPTVGYVKEKLSGIATVKATSQKTVDADVGGKVIFLGMKVVDGEGKYVASYANVGVLPASQIDIGKGIVVKYRVEAGKTTFDVEGEDYRLEEIEIVVY